ncbi:MAG: DNA polymerase III subunit alpha, partial [Bacteroidota bacterium]
MRFGTFSEMELLQLAQQNHVARLVLTDINNTSACLNFVRKAPEYNVSPILGIDFRNGVQACYVGIAKNNQGYLELNNFLSHHLHHDMEFPTQAPTFQNAFVIYPFEQVLLHELQNFKENEFIGVSLKNLRKLPFSGLMRFQNKLVVQQPVTFRNKQDFNAHRLLRAIDTNVLLSKLPKEEEADEDEKMYPIENLAAAFSEYPFILENTERLLKQCSIHFDFSKGRKPQNRNSYLGSVEEDEKLIEKLCYEGLPYRYEKVTQSIKNRLD